MTFAIKRRPPPSDGISSHQFFTLFFAIESCIYGTVFTLGPNQKYNF